jgi:hypothetical protein
MSSQTIDPTIESMSRPVSEVAATLAPRYHFAAAANCFYEREPYRNIPGFEPAGARSAQHVTRFIGLAEVGNPQKARVSCLIQGFNNSNGANIRIGSGSMRSILRL